MTSHQAALVREAVGVFSDASDMQAAIDDLLSHGFDRSEISLLASDHAVRSSLGRAYRSVRYLEDKPEVPTTAYVSTESIGDAQGGLIGGLLYIGAMAGMIPVVVSGGALAAALVAGTIGGGAGAAIGSVLASIIGQQHADAIESQLEQGGLLLWVRTWTEGDEARALRILRAHSATDVHVHGIPEHHETAFQDRFLGDVSATERAACDHGTIVTTGHGTSYAFGKVFSSRDEAKAYIDRRAYLETLAVGARHSAFDLHTAMVDPGAVFSSPKQVIDSSLSPSLQIELLRRWADDQRALERAGTEGMPVPAGGDLLQDIQKALLSLSGGEG